MCGDYSWAKEAKPLKANHSKQICPLHLILIRSLKDLEAVSNCLVLRCWVFKEWAGKLLLGVCQDPAFLTAQPRGSLRCLIQCAPWHFLLARTPVCVLSAPDSSSLTLLPGGWLPRETGEKYTYCIPSAIFSWLYVSLAEQPSEQKKCR